MRLINGQEANFHPLQSLNEGISLQSFRRHIKELQSTINCLIISQIEFVGVHPRIDGRSGNVFLHEVSHLVFHQCNERRDDEAKSVHRHRRHLKADALAAARRQKRESILPRNYGIYDFLLEGAEGGVAPIFLKYGSCGR